ncbi:hypothetical protein E4U11_002651 [Claviceps purpurea]|nr:hypothetical protein E4U11_002651 [Claviceps purpurea]
MMILNKCFKGQLIGIARLGPPTAVPFVETREASAYQPHRYPHESPATLKPCSWPKHSWSWKANKAHLGQQNPEVEDVAFGSGLKALVKAPVALLDSELCQVSSGRDDAIGVLDQDYLSASPALDDQGIVRSKRKIIFQSKAAFDRATRNDPQLQEELEFLVPGTGRGDAGKGGPDQC